MIKIYREFAKEIRSEDIKKIYLLYGDERFLLDKALEEMKDVIVTGFEEMNYTLFHGKDINISYIEGACDTLPFGSDKKLVVVKDLAILKAKKRKGKKDEREGEGEEIASGGETGDFSFLEDIPEDTCLLFINNGSVDRRKKLFKDIKKNGSIFQFKKINKRDLSRWVTNYFEREEKKVGPKELNYFLQRIGYLDKDRDMNLYHVKNELEKIIGYMGEEEVLKMEHMETLLKEPLENNIFKLIDAAYDGNISGSLRIYSDLILQGESPYSVIGLMTWGIRNLIKIKDLKDARVNPKDIAKKIKLNPYVVRNYYRICSKFDYESLEKAFQRCLDCEGDIKSGKLEERLAVEMMLTTLF